jgi:hypothetical protein
VALRPAWTTITLTLCATRSCSSRARCDILGHGLDRAQLVLALEQLRARGERVDRATAADRAADEHHGEIGTR